MKTIYAVSLLIFISIQLSAQIKFTPGYILDNKGEKSDCMLYNPGLEYKGEDYILKRFKNAKQENVDIETMSEFGIEGLVKFVRSKIVVDISEDVIESIKDTLDHQEWEEGHVFLCELVGSDIASLYYFFYEGKEYFFYKKDNSPIENLIFKKYKLELTSGDASQILFDNRFKEQLKLYFPCSKSTESVSYTKNSLIKYFKAFIEEQNSEVQLYKQNTKGQLQFIVAGMRNNNSFYIEKDAILGMDFEEGNSWAYGLEIDYLFKFNRNKLGLFTEASYLEYASTYKDPNTGQLSGLDYKVIEMPLGVIYNFNLPKEFKIYTKVGLVPNFVSDKSSIYINTEGNNYTLESSANFLFGVGIKYKELAAEFRRYTSRNITQHLYNKGSEFDQMSFRISYTFLSLKGK